MGAIAGFIIWCVCGGIFMLFGIYAWYAEKPVRFWTVQDKIQVRDVKKYNRAVGKLWMVSAIIFIMIGAPLLAEQNSAYIVIPILGSEFWAIGVMCVYVRIEGKYRI